MGCDEKPDCGRINFCATGLPYWTLDIGAFFTGGINNWRKWCGNPEAKGVWFWNGDFEKGVDDLGYRELYTRWFQYGTFLPMFRSHGTDTPREVWQFGEPGTVFYDTLVKYICLRYRLLPYIYSLAGWVTLDSYTILRMLPFDFREDMKTYNIPDQYMFGPAFLVNPVTTQMYYGSGSRELTDTDKIRRVYLPEGSGWYDFWTNEKYSGKQTINAKADISIMPLFVKAGSIVPMGPVVHYSDEKPDAVLEFRIYPGKDCSFKLYEDEGDNYRYEKGEYSLINFKWTDEIRQLEIEDRIGKVTGMIENRVFKIILIDKEHGAGIHESSNVDRVVSYEGRYVKICL